MSWRVPRVVTCATFLAACSPRVQDATSIAVAVVARYGAADTRWDRRPDHLTLALTLTDRRWTVLGSVPGLRDSALAVARFTLGKIDKAPGLARPDSIVVTIQTMDRGVAVLRQTAASRFGFASKDL